MKNPNDMALTPLGLRFQGLLWPCTIGKGGISGAKREGDGATPRGSHQIVGMLYRPDRIAQPTEWASPSGPRDRWSDAANDTADNTMVRAPYPHSHEKLRRADPLYDLILLTDWNWPNAVSGHGSAIFIHQYRRSGYPTEGCVAFSRPHLHKIARQITKRTRLIVP
jgi:L,D-peptidoglycan transpeptidase YkuD (ErfK/YbiS/YcfS/YnhG family)